MLVFIVLMSQMIYVYLLKKEMLRKFWKKQNKKKTTTKNKGLEKKLVKGIKICLKKRKTKSVDIAANDIQIFNKKHIKTKASWLKEKLFFNIEK